MATVGRPAAPGQRAATKRTIVVLKRAFPHLARAHLRLRCGNAAVSNPYNWFGQ
jgi:hypothetical protein